MEATLIEAEQRLTREEKPTSVCFVCTGNTCRSPMAEAVLKHLGGDNFKVCSAGVSAVTGDPITANAVKALQRAGIESTPENDYASHTATMINEDIMRDCDRIIAISGSHMMALIYAYPHHASKIEAMPRDIPDPFMYGEEVYCRCLEMITECIKEMFFL